MKINSLKFNNSTIHKMYHGDELVNKIGDAFTYMEASGDTPTPPTPSYDTQYITIESTSNNNTIYWKARGSSNLKTISASTDNGETWTAYTSTNSGSGTTIATLNSGDKLLVKGENAQYNGQGAFNSTSSFIVYGNIMSLVYGDNFSGQTTLTSGNTFKTLFSGCTGLTSAENLILPATTLADSCYSYMFYNCSSLTAAPQLPATTLADWCYGDMFHGCTSLRTAPELPAATLVDYCYMFMFQGCTSLNYIKCLATDISASDCTVYWVFDVSPTGTFVKAASMNGWIRDDSDGIPNGWTIVNA